MASLDVRGTACAVVGPWVKAEERAAFLEAWAIDGRHAPRWLVMERDADRSGCGATKNRGVDRAVEGRADVDLRE